MKKTPLALMPLSSGGLYPQMLFYAFFFIGLLTMEAKVVVARLLVAQSCSMIVALILFLFDFAER